MHSKNTYTHKLIQQEIPSPSKGYIPLLFNNFSTRSVDICENLLIFSVDSEIENCFNFFFDTSNLILWNSFIYQILDYKDNSHNILHCFF